MNYFNGLKNALPRLWNDRVRIVGTQPVKKGYITNNEDVTIVEDEPAKVILKGQSPSDIYSALQATNTITDNYVLLLNNFRRLPAE